MRGVPRTQSFADSGGLTGRALSAWALSCVVCMVKAALVPSYGVTDTVVGLAWLSLLRLLAGNRLVIGFCMASVFTDIYEVFAYHQGSDPLPPFIRELALPLFIRELALPLFIWKLALGAILCFFVRNPDSNSGDSHAR